MREYHTSREFKLAGNPWWADGTSEDAAIEFYLLKGQCPEIFDQFFVKSSTCALYKQAKRFRNIFWRVRVAVDYADYDVRVVVVYKKLLQNMAHFY